MCKSVFRIRAQQWPSHDCSFTASAVISDEQNQQSVLFKMSCYWIKSSVAFKPNKCCRKLPLNGSAEIVLLPNERFSSLYWLMSQQIVKQNSFRPISVPSPVILYSSVGGRIFHSSALIYGGLKKRKGNGYKITQLNSPRFMGNKSYRGGRQRVRSKVIFFFHPTPTSEA